ncbi:MAG TPA: NAD(P)H-dependent oxidoreductase subunit E [Candidatus Baltobacteraceae bacterium]|nr:NAD(P)H-dependent oxidoreductase subunit E [Candidatus Baltobacteraceae bacterium]
MDLHFTAAAPTPEERDAIDALLAKSPHADAAAGKAARDRRHLLLPALHAIAQRVGWISEGALNYACERLTVAPADAYGVATFYAMFATKPQAPVVLHVCDDIACMCAGARELCQTLESAFGPAGSPHADAHATWLRSPCLGLCDRAPAALLVAAGTTPVHRQIAPIAPEAAVSLLSGNDTNHNGAAAPHVGGSQIRLLQRVGTIDPQSLEEYRAHGGYQALRKAFELGSQGVVAETIASNLLGRGGAAFPAGRKMESVAAAPARPHSLVCNADESEPGTFKDRILMEHDPFAVIEAMTIAAFAASCERGFIYVRGEYPLAAHRLQHAIETARAHKLLGADVMGSGFAFDVEIRRGAGAYICGEETALFNSIEGKRGEPRSKPPFPAQFGLFGKPTLVNNVETLVNLLPIVLHGAAAYAAVGTAASTGTRLFCLSGTVQRPGLYEVPHGTTLGTLIEMAGGVAPARSLQTVLLGGAAGSFVGPQALSMPLTFEDARAAGATLGSGVVMLFDDTIELMPILLRIARFFREESCGQCVPCRVGTVRQEEALQRLNSGTGTHDVDLIDEIGRAMRDASICGLGQTAASAIASARDVLRAFAAKGAS